MKNPIAATAIPFPGAKDPFAASAIPFPGAGRARAAAAPPFSGAMVSPAEAVASTARAITLIGEIPTFRSQANAAVTDLATKKETRDADRTALYQRLTGLRAELDQLLGDDDPIWYAFGFSRPADGDSPGPISTLNLTPVGAGSIVATWTHALRAERYRVFKKAIGTDPDPVQIASDVEGLTFTLLGLPTGATVEVFIIAANDTGDGPPSPTVPAVVP